MINAAGKGVTIGFFEVIWKLNLEIQRLWGPAHGMNICSSDRSRCGSRCSCGNWCCCSNRRCCGSWCCCSNCLVATGQSDSGKKYSNQGQDAAEPRKIVLAGKHIKFTRHSHLPLVYATTPPGTHLLGKYAENPTHRN